MDMNIIQKYEEITKYHYCIYDDINTTLGKNNLIIYDNRKNLKYYKELFNNQKYNYLHINKNGDIKIKDIIISMTTDSFYSDFTFYNEYIFLEGFEKVTEVQYKPIYGKWVEY